MADWRLLERVQAVFSPTTALRRGATLMAAGKTGLAFRLYARAGRTGLAEAEYRVARCYLDGVGVPPSRAEGIRWLELAARHGHVEAQSQLAVIYPDGTAGDEADLWYEHSAAAGCPQGMLGHALALMHGIGVDANPSGGGALRRAALAGDPEAAAALGDLYATGGNLPPNHVEAASWFRRAAEAGHKGAARSLGLLYFAGAGVPRDPEQGMQWFRISAAAGDGRARAELGNLVLTGMGEEDDRIRIYKGFERAAALGDPVAAYNCAVCLSHGVGVARDDREAALWLREAADRVLDAQFWYGRVLVEGRGVDRDLVEGRRWIAGAAEVGMVDAQVALGMMMLTGAGGACDPPGALALFEKAAANGHLAAMFATGVVYGGGLGVPADHGAAEHWFRAAAEHGHPAAQMMLERHVAANAAASSRSA